MSTWSDALYDTLLDAGVRQVGYVPDAGHKRLIELCLADKEHARGRAQHRGGRHRPRSPARRSAAQRGALLMQSSGVGQLHQPALARCASAAFRC